MNEHQREIHFLLPNRYGIPVGGVRPMDIGVAELLVRRGIAEYLDDTPKSAAAISEPVATESPVADEPEPPKETTKRKNRRSDSTEENDE